MLSLDGGPACLLSSANNRARRKTKTGFRIPDSGLGFIGVCVPFTAAACPLIEGRLPDTRVFRSETPCIEGRGEDGRDDDGECSITLSRCDPTASLAGAVSKTTMLAPQHGYLQHLDLVSDFD